MKWRGGAAHWLRRAAAVGWLFAVLGAGGAAYEGGCDDSQREPSYEQRPWKDCQKENC